MPLYTVEEMCQYETVKFPVLIYVIQSTSSNSQAGTSHRHSQIGICICNHLRLSNKPATRPTAADDALQITEEATMFTHPLLLLLAENQVLK